eukprot:m.194668 g.194668  ORF g.194668 m.194668 type:complete len:865 (-) comp16795_c5_seq8:208-2802(-)
MLRLGKKAQAEEDTTGWLAEEAHPRPQATAEQVSRSAYSNNDATGANMAVLLGQDAIQAQPGSPRRHSLSARHSSAASTQSVSPRGSKRRTLKGFFKQFVSTKQTYRVFGEDLSLAVRRTSLPDNLHLPAVFRRCLLYIQHQGLTQEGIYRRSATHSQVEKLKAAFEQEGDIDLYAYFGEGSTSDVNTAASLLKQYLRDLPETLLTNQLNEDFNQAVKQTVHLSTAHRTNKVRALLVQLPRCNYLMLAWLFKHFEVIAANADQNLMSLDNLYIVFAPTLAVSKDVMLFLVNHAAELFPDVDIVDYLPPPPTRRSRKRAKSKGLHAKHRAGTDDPLQPMPHADVLARTENARQLLSQLSSDIVALEKALIAFEAEMAVYEARNEDYPEQQRQQMEIIQQRLSTDRQCYERLQQRVPGTLKDSAEQQLVKALKESYAALAHEHIHLQRVHNALQAELRDEDRRCNTLERLELSFNMDLDTDDEDNDVDDDEATNPDMDARARTLVNLKNRLDQLQQENEKLSAENTVLLKNLNDETIKSCEMAGDMLASAEAIQLPLLQTQLANLLHVAPMLSLDAQENNVWSSQFQERALSSSQEERAYASSTETTVIHRWSSCLSELVVAPFSSSMVLGASDSESSDCASEADVTSERRETLLPHVTEEDFVAMSDDIPTRHHRDNGQGDENDADADNCDRDGRDFIVDTGDDVNPDCQVLATRLSSLWKHDVHHHDSDDGADSNDYVGLKGELDGDCSRSATPFSFSSGPDREGGKSSRSSSRLSARQQSTSSQGSERTSGLPACRGSVFFRATENDAECRDDHLLSATEFVAAIEAHGHHGPRGPLSSTSSHPPSSLELSVDTSEYDISPLL